MVSRRGIGIRIFQLQHFLSFSEKLEEDAEYEVIGDISKLQEDAEKATEENAKTEATDSANGANKEGTWFTIQITALLSRLI